MTDAMATRHETRIRVRYTECDPMGVAHHSVYAVWLEMARTEMLRATGRTYAAMEAAGAFLVITRLDLRYRRPIRYDDLLEVCVWVERSTAARVDHGYEITLIEPGTPSSTESNPTGAGGVETAGGVLADAAPGIAPPAVPAGTVCTTATTQLACVGADGRVRPMPEWLRGIG